MLDYPINYAAYRIRLSDTDQPMVICYRRRYDGELTVDAIFEGAWETLLDVVFDLERSQNNDR